jgi:hypothetical protein
MSEKGDRDAAIDVFRRALAIWPDDARAHNQMALVLFEQGRFAEALASYRRSLKTGLKHTNLSRDSARRVEECERFVALEARLPAILKGEDAAKDGGERIALAVVCYYKALHVDSARFYGEAFAADAALAEAGKTSHRYNAACAAALAGSGKGRDDPPPDDAARVKLRARALGWLRDDLAAWGKVVEGDKPQAGPLVVKQLAHWKVDSDLAGIRDESELAKLPEPEREPLRSLWADVEALRKKAETKAAASK